MEVPGLRALEARYHGDFMRYLQNAHTFHFTAATLSYVLARAGFEGIHADEWARAVATPAAGPPPAEVPVPANEARETLAYLRRLERRRRAAA